MRKGSWLSLVTAGMLVGGAAYAEPPPSSSSSNPATVGTERLQGAIGRSDEPRKHLTEIDLYLRDAVNNTKVLYATTQLVPGGLDSSIEKEGLANLDKSLSGALVHINHIQSLPDAKIVDMDRLVDLKAALVDARGIVGKLKFAIRSDSKTQIQALSSQLYSQLRTADDVFGRIADKQHVARIDQINVPERQPVSGKARPGDLDNRNALPSPATPLDSIDPMERRHDTSNLNQQNQAEPTPLENSPDTGLQRPNLDNTRGGSPDRGGMAY